jgi:hypothetical protein
MNILKPVFRNEQKVENLAELDIPTQTGRGLQFDTSQGAPALPVKGYGELWYACRDIPRRYVVDAAGQAWMNDIDDGPVRKVKSEQLMGAAESDKDKGWIAPLLGLEKPTPEWARIALAAGWKPPKGWKP